MKRIISALMVMCIALISMHTFIYAQQPIKLQQKNAIYYNKMGWEHLQSGNAYAAIIAFQNALAQNPKYKEALLGLGNAYLLTEGYSESVKLFQKVLALYPNNEQALLGLAKSYSGLGLYKEAMKLYDQLNELSYNNNESRYGMALLYFKMGNMLWAKRLLQRILQNDPYHYDSLLLFADIKAKDKRIDEAIVYVKKAIDAKETYPDAFVKLAELLYLQYYYTGNTAYLHQAINELQKALAINKLHVKANRDMGFLLYYTGNYQNAIQYYETIATHYPYITNNEILYNIGLMHEYMNNMSLALDYYVKALEKDNLNSCVSMKIRQFCILENIKMGNPIRIQASNDDFTAWHELKKKGLSDLSLYFIRLSIMLNPNHSKARQELIQLYEAQELYEFYYDEIKKMHTLNPTSKSYDLMNIAVMNRRDKLFFRLGYDKEDLPRDVPLVLVLNFYPDVPVPTFADAGSVIANSTSLAMEQFGRYRVLPLSQRISIIKSLSSNNLDDIITTINEKVRQNQLPPIMYILYGQYTLSGRYVELNAKLMDIKTGIVIAHYNAFDNSKYSIPFVAVQIAKYVYNTIPFYGKIISYYNDSMVVINLGNVDGIQNGSFLESFVESDDLLDSNKPTKKVIFEVKETGAHVCVAACVNPKDIDLVSKGLIVYPVEKRRAKKIR